MRPNPLTPRRVKLAITLLVLVASCIGALTTMVPGNGATLGIVLSCTYLGYWIHEGIHDRDED